jgi:hypothetical protein
MVSEANKKSSGGSPQQSVVQSRTEGLGPQNPDRSEPQHTDMSLLDWLRRNWRQDTAKTKKLMWCRGNTVGRWTA